MKLQKLYKLLKRPKPLATLEFFIVAESENHPETTASALLGMRCEVNVNSLCAVAIIGGKGGMA